MPELYQALQSQAPHVVLSAAGSPYLLNGTMEASIPCQNLTLQGEAAGRVVVDGAGARLLRMSTHDSANFSFCQVTLRGLILQGGVALVSTSADPTAVQGGAFDVCCGELFVVDSVVRNNTAAAGGAFVVRGSGSLSLLRSIVHDNSAVDKGGSIYISDGSASLEGCHVIDNTASQSGAVHASSGTLTLTECSFERNAARSFAGGAVSVEYSARLTATASVFRDNTAVLAAEALLFASDQAMSLLDNCTFDGPLTTSIVSIISKLSWRCQLGYWMPPAGSFTTSFAGCLHPCPRGYFGNSPFLTNVGGPGGCKACPTGSYCPSEATVVPVACPSGTHLPAAGAASDASCIACSPGTFNDVPGSAASSCTLCPRGKYARGLGNTACSDCHRGGYCPRLGAPLALAELCPAGTFQPNLGAQSSAACLSCREGKFNPNAGATSSAQCRRCRPGTFASSIGLHNCTPCVTPLERLPDCHAGARLRACARLAPRTPGVWQGPTSRMRARMRACPASAACIACQA